METDDGIAGFGRTQHGLVTRAQLDSLGMDASAVRYRVRSGDLRRVRYDVFAIPGAPATRSQHILTAVLAFGPGAVASHETAAVLWQIPNVSLERIEVTCCRSHRVRLRGVVAHETGSFLTEEHTTRDAIPVTTVARTLVDLSARLSPVQLAIATDDALRRNTLTLAQLRRCVSGLAPAPGRRMSRIHDVLAARLPGYDPGDSDLEVRVLRAIVAAGLPEPAQQHSVRLPSRRYRLDLAYAEPIKVGIEVDGFGPHTTRSAFDRDRARANDLVVAGWTLLRFTSASTDEQIASTVAATLAGFRHDAAS
jgi:predicted transcriptional regulator of viral defense system